MRNHFTILLCVACVVAAGSLMAQPETVQGFNAGSDAYFWSSTDDGTDYARNRNLYYDSKYVGRYGDNRSRGFSVRCVRD